MSQIARSRLSIIVAAWLTVGLTLSACGSKQATEPEGAIAPERQIVAREPQDATACVTPGPNSSTGIGDPVCVPAPAPPVQGLAEDANDTTAADDCTKLAGSYKSRLQDPANTLTVGFACLDPVITITVTGIGGGVTSEAFLMVPGAKSLGQPLSDSALDALAVAPSVSEGAQNTGNMANNGGGAPYESDQRRVFGPNYGETTRNIYYGDYRCNTSSGCDYENPEFESSVLVTLSVFPGSGSGQDINFKWIEREDMEITYETITRLRRDRGYSRPDATTDFRNLGPADVYSDHDEYYDVPLNRDDDGRYFVEAYKTEIRSREHGLFLIYSKVQTPRFRCERSCSYPGGREA